MLEVGCTEDKHGCPSSRAESGTHNQGRLHAGWKLGLPLCPGFSTECAILNIRPHMLAFRSKERGKGLLLFWWCWGLNPRALHRPSKHSITVQFQTLIFKTWRFSLYSESHITSVNQTIFVCLEGTPSSYNLQRGK